MVNKDENTEQVLVWLNYVLGFAEENTLKDVYDVAYFQQWLNQIEEIQKETRKIISNKMKERFDLVKLPRYVNSSSYIYKSSTYININVFGCLLVKMVYSGEIFEWNS